jgi:hypothetical protein
MNTCDGVLPAIRHVKRRLLDRFEGLDDRVANLDKKIDKLNLRIAKQEHAIERPGRTSKIKAPKPAGAKHSESRLRHPGARRGLSRVCEIPLPTKPAGQKPDAFGPSHRRFAQDNLPTTEPDGSQRRPRSVLPDRAAERPGQLHRQGKDHLASRAHWTRRQRPGSKRAVAAGRWLARPAHRLKRLLCR